MDSKENVQCERVLRTRQSVFQYILPGMMEVLLHVAYLEAHTFCNHLHHPCKTGVVHKCGSLVEETQGF
jgi:hypothetical protein